MDTTVEALHEQLLWYRRRVAALEKLVTRYRLQSTVMPSLAGELVATRARIDSDGNWIGDE